MPKEREPTNSGRGRYTPKACNICRARKSKCDGEKPSCGSCTAQGRGEECSWARDTSHRKPRTEAYFEALRKRNDALQAYVTVLEGMLAKCACQDVSAHHQFRPPMDLEAVGKDSPPLETKDEALDPGDEITRELCLPTQFLKLDDKLGGLLRYGSATPFRFAASPSIESSRSQSTVDGRVTYVLMVDGVDKTAYDLNFDWSRHLPPEVPLNRKEHDKILDLFFKFFSIFSLRVVPSLFLRDMYHALSVPESQRTPKTPNYSPMLHNAILALASAFSDDPRLQDMRTRDCFIAAARDCLEAECQKPDVSLVHALQLMGTYHADKGATILGDCYHGMSARVSQALGLGTDTSAWVKAGLITDDEMRGRNYAHWTLFALDVCWALYFGRESLSAPEKKDTPMPFVSSESDQVLWYHAPANIPPQPNHLSLIFSASTSLFLIARKIVQLLDDLSHPNTAQKSLSNDQAVTQIDLELNRWKSQLPPEIDITLANRARSTPQKLTLHCIYWWCFILLHRPFFNRRARPVQISDSKVDHIKLCKRAAENIMELLETWSNLYTLRYNPVILLQVAFSAGTIFLLLSLQAALSVRIAHRALQTSLAQIELCIQNLDDMGKSWHSASRTTDILRGLVDTKLRPVITRRCSLVAEPNPVPVRDRTAEADVFKLLNASDSSASWKWAVPQDTMGDILDEMPWPQAHWDFFNDPSAIALDGFLDSSTSFGSPMLSPRAETFGADAFQLLPPTSITSLDSIMGSEYWEQRILGA